MLTSKFIYFLGFYFSENLHAWTYNFYVIFQFFKSYVLASKFIYQIEAFYTQVNLCKDELAVKSILRKNTGFAGFTGPFCGMPADQL